MAEPGGLPSGVTQSQTRLKRAACSFPGENARSWEALGEARPGQSSLSAGALLSWKLKGRMTWGDQALVSKAHSFIFNRGFYTLSYT